MHEYCLFGLALRSEMPLPELDPCEHGNADAVTIRLSEVLEIPRNEGDLPLRVTSLGAVLTIPGVARFRVRAGNSILVERSSGASDRNVRLFLLGSVMGVLLHQRGILPLHANAIAFDGHAVAFLGHSGAGKSTLAAAFHDRGSGILSDDVCALVRQEDGFVAQAGIPRLRLWRDAVERSGRIVDGHERAFDAVDKYTVPTASEARGIALPLRAIYLLVREDDVEPEIRPLSGLATVRALMENTYRGAFVGTVGDAATHFQTCLALSRAVPVFELVRPWDAREIEPTIAYVETHLRSLPA